MATITATLADHQNRLQNFMCCLGTKGNDLATKLKLGFPCTCEINTLELLTAYWDILVCYNPALTTNCLTQQQVDLVWEAISKECGICFSPYGSTYITASTAPLTTQANTLLTTEGTDTLFTET